MITEQIRQLIQNAVNADFTLQITAVTLAVLLKQNIIAFEDHN